MAMRTPSVKTLSQVFTDPKEAKRLLTMPYAELRKLPAAQARINECHHRPAQHDVRMHCLNAIEPGLFGLEACQTVAGDGMSSDEYADYLNTGDHDAPTLIHWRGNFRVQAVSDFIERSRVAFR